MSPMVVPLSPMAVVQRLIEDCPWLGDPVRAFDQCIAASSTLAKDLTVAGYQARTVTVHGFMGGVSGITATGALPNLWKTVIPVGQWSHMVCWVPEWGDGEVTHGEGAFIDLTARQFDPDAAFPLVETRAELLTRWVKVPDMARHDAGVSLQRVATKEPPSEP